MTRKGSIVNDHSNVNYEEGNEITYNIEFLKSNLCNCSNPYIIVTGEITVTGVPQRQVAFKSCAPFTKCITKIDGTTINGHENFDLIMPM